MWIVALLGLVVPNGGLAASQLYPRIPGIPNSPLYAVTVDGKPLEIGSESLNGNKFFETGAFSVSGTAKITVRSLQGPGTFTIHPLNLAIANQAAGDSIVFTLDRPLKLMIKTGSQNPLLLFATPPESFRPKPGDNNVLYFAAGTHVAGVIKPVSDQIIYLEPGALVKGRIDARDVKRVQILGRGVLDARGYTAVADSTNAVGFRRCANIRMEGIGIRASDYWQVLFLLTDYADVSHLNLLSFGRNNDGVDLDGSKHIRVRNSFIGCGDDGFGWHAVDAKTNGEATTEDCLADSCVIYNAYAGNGLRVGASMEAKEFKNITFRNIDVVAHLNYAIFSDHSDWAWVRELHFEHFRDEMSIGLIGMDIAKTRYSNSNGYKDERGHIQGVTFYDVQAPGGKVYFKGNDSTHLIEDLDFYGCANGAPIDNLAKIEVNTFVKNVRFFTNGEKPTAAIHPDISAFIPSSIFGFYPRQRYSVSRNAKSLTPIRTLAAFSADGRLHVQTFDSDGENLGPPQSLRLWLPEYR